MKMLKIFLITGLVMALCIMAFAGGCNSLSGKILEAPPAAARLAARAHFFKDIRKPTKISEEDNKAQHFNE